MWKLVFGIFGIFIVIFFIWRLSSRRYTLPCPTWLAWMVELDNPFSKINRAATIIKNLDLKPGMTVLDIGCGPGRVTIPLARELGPTGHIIAMDIQAGMLEKVQAKARTENLTNISFLHAGIGENKLEHNKFDRVLLVTVLGEIPDQKIALQEIFNTLKPGGILSITEIVFDPHFQRQSTILKLTGSLGFKEKNRFGNSIAFTLNLEKLV